MINSILFHTSARLPCRLINRDDGERYLERYYLGQFAGATFYLHRFIKRDPGERLHNHPWGWGRSVVLTGAYIEERVDDFAESECVTHRATVRYTNRVDGNDFHRIAKVAPGTWTLFAHGPRLRYRGRLKGWGFLQPLEGGVLFVPHRTAANHTWWATAPAGKDADRAALN